MDAIMKRESGDRRRRRTVAIFLLTLWASFSMTVSAASAECPRDCEVWAYGYKEPEPGAFRMMRNVKIYQTIAFDPTFNRGVFLEHFKEVFSGSRLRIDAKGDPEYSLTGTFSKKIDLNSGRPVSCMTVTLGFNGGKRGSGYGSLYWLSTSYDDGSGVPEFQRDRNDFPCHYHEALLFTWHSIALGHDVAAHVPLIASQVDANTINQFLADYEQIPISVKFEDKPYWCDDNHPRATASLRFFALTPAGDKIPNVPYAHQVRMIVRAEKGKILNGTVSVEDEKARIFDFSAPRVSGATMLVEYELPKGADRSDAITVYNSCEVRYETVIPLAKTKKNVKLVEIENQCGWEGTLSMKESMAAGEKGSGLAALVPGMEYDLAKNWMIRLKLKRKSASGDITRYEVEEAALASFRDTMDATLARMEREGRKIESRSKETAKASGRRLGKGECDLELVIDSKGGTYSLEGEIDVQGIKIRGQDEMDIKVKPIDKEIDEDADGTTGIEEEIAIRGKFPPAQPPCVPEELKGEKDLMDEVPDEFREFMEDLGGKQSYVLHWVLKRKPVRVTLY